MPWLSKLRNRLRFQSLNAKLLLPIIGLMLASVLTGTLAFGLGTLQTRNQLLNQQIEQDLLQTSRLIAGRVDAVRSAASILAADPAITQALQEKNEASLALVDQHAVLVRNRFQLDLIQVYGPSGEAWANLVLAELYRVSSLIDQVQNNATVVLALDGNLVLITRSDIGYGAGTVITGVDLGSELKSIASGQRLVADLFIRYQDSEENSLPAGVQVSADAAISREQALQLGGSLTTLVVRRRTAEIDQVTQAGMMVMVTSSLITIGLLVALASRITPALIAPIQNLARVAEAVAIQHQFEGITPIPANKSLLNIGVDDEIGQLTAAFNTMLIELRDLTHSLEQKVTERTLQLAAASAVARAASSSLEVETVLQTAVNTICQQFDLYFTGVFIIEPDKAAAVLRAATGKVGELADGSAYLMLPLNQISHVTSAIHSGQPVITQDISTSKTYMPHPLLPETRAEAVFPLAHAGRVIGAIDIQADQTDIFNAALLDTFAILSDQIAVAIQNAQMYRQQREIASRLAEIDHLKTQFLSTVTHELRTPLNAIIGFSKVLVKGLDGPVNEMQLRDLRAIHEGGQHLLNLINDMLDISRLEAGQMMLDITTVDLRREIIGMTGQVEDWIGAKSIQYEFDLPNDLPTIQGDVTRLRQVLRNLLSNAVKFTRSGGVMVTAVHSPQWVVVNIKDTGIGIAPDDLDKLFRPFSQVDGAANRRYEGIGLGLSIARYLIELHGGKIWAEGVLGQGTTFSFILPIRRI